MSIVTISRRAFSGGQRFAEDLAEHLGFEVLSREVLLDAARRYGISEEKLSEGIESPPGLWQRLTHQKEHYLLAIQASLAERIAQGKVIYHGLAGQFLLKDLPWVLKIRLINSQEERLQTAMTRHSLTRQEALQRLQQLDEQRIRWVRLIYNEDWSSPALYNLAINLEHLGKEEVIEMVATLTQSPSFRLTPERAQELQEYALKRRVLAELAFHSSFPHNAVEVAIQNRTVYLAGGGYFARHKTEIARFVQSIDGVEEVQINGIPLLLPDGNEQKPEKTAADLMIPLHKYPHIDLDTTLREAIVALSASAVELQDGHLISPRYLLVFHQRRRLAGIIARRDLLKGLSPQLQSLEKTIERVEASSLPIDVSHMVDYLWISFFGPAAAIHAHAPVRSIVAPIKGTISADSPLSKVVMTMLQHGIDLVPVLQQDQVIGVVLMTDVFDSVAQHIMEQPPSPT